MDSSFLSEFFSSPFQMCALFSCALLIGMSKTGLQSINVISIPIMAIAFGAKASTGVILPMLCFADLIAVSYYRRNADWKCVVRLLPAAVAGFFLAIATDDLINPDAFGALMAACILGGIAVMLFSSRRAKRSQAGVDSGGVKTAWWYSVAFGLAGGFTTMIGNAAGPVMAVYLLSMRLSKLNFVGTSAWFFLLVNFLKLPLQYFVWDNISMQTLSLNCIAIPFIILGAFVGIWLVKRLPEKSFRVVITSLTLLSTILLFF